MLIAEVVFVGALIVLSAQLRLFPYLCLAAIVISAFVPVSVIAAGDIKLGVSLPNVIAVAYLLAFVVNVTGRHGPRIRRPDRLSIAVILWVVVVVVSTSAAIVFHPMWSDYVVESIIRCANWTFGLAVFLTYRSIGYEQEVDGPRFMRFLQLVFLFGGCLGLFSLVVGEHMTVAELLSMRRVLAISSGAGTDVQGLSELCAFGIVLSLANIERLHRSAIPLMTIALLLLNLAASYAREGVATLFLGVLVLLLVDGGWLRVVAVVAATGAVLLPGAGHIGFVEYLKTSVQRFQAGDMSVLSGRADIWSGFLTGFLPRYGVTGVGFWMLGPAMQSVQTAAHNSFLQSLAVAGPIGLVLFCFVIGLSLIESARAARRLNGHLGSCAFATLVGFTLSGLFSDHFYVFPSINMFVWILLGAAWNSNSTTNGRDKVDLSLPAASAVERRLRLRTKRSVETMADQVCSLRSRAGA